MEKNEGINNIFLILVILGFTFAFGSGIGVFLAIVCAPSDPYFGDCPPAAHNMYVQMAAETGIASFFIFMFLLYQMFRQAKQKLCQNDKASLDSYILAGLIAGMAAFLIHGLFESAFQSSIGAVLFWFMAGIIVTKSKCVLTKLKGLVKNG